MRVAKVKGFLLLLSVRVKGRARGSDTGVCKKGTVFQSAMIAQARGRAMARAQMAWITK
jgi:hypothetical protein